jgi:hypothetical protein
MRYIKLFLLIIFLSPLTQPIFANPIVIYYITEFKIDSSGWQLEMVDKFNYFFDGINLDGYFLTSLTDTGYFKDGLTIDTTYRVYNQSNLHDTLYINPEGDRITVYNNNGQFVDRLYFGNADGSQIVAPKSNQSVNLRETYAYWQNIYYYLDNTPTLGSENDSLNAMGYLDILVTDLYDTPLVNFEIIYEWNGWYFLPEYQSFFTGADGKFLLKNYAQRQHLYLHPYEIICSEQILPEDTVAVTIKIDTNISAIDITKKIQPSKYLLNQNYPNPFNNSTNIAYYLPENEYIQITVYDINGKKIQTLYNGHQSRGAHVLTWNAGLLATGVYIYQLKTTNTTTSNKCMIIK